MGGNVERTQATLAISHPLVASVPNRNKSHRVDDKSDNEVSSSSFRSSSDADADAAHASSIAPAMPCTRQTNLPNAGTKESRNSDLIDEIILASTSSMITLFPSPSSRYALVLASIDDNARADDERIRNSPWRDIVPRVDRAWTWL